MAGGEDRTAIARRTWRLAAALLMGAWLALIPARAADSAVILQYHHFGSHTPPEASVTIAQFEQHLAYLEEAGCAVWPLTRIVEHLQQGRPLPENCVALTIDDAYGSLYEEAFPRLRARGWPFTVFVPSAALDERWRPYVTWDQLREMAAAGATLGLHSHTHAHLIARLPAEDEAAWEARMVEEITRNRRRLTAEVGTVAPIFAYPYGEYDPALQAIVRDLGLIGCGQHSGAIGPDSDWSALPRFALSRRYAEPKEFAIRVRSLPLPVVSAAPASPVLAPGTDRPRLRVQLAPGAYRAEALAAYATGEGRIALRWIDREAGLLELEAGAPLPAGRSRYNLTAPQRNGDRYYWYSHLWIRPLAPR